MRCKIISEINEYKDTQLLRKHDIKKYCLIEDNTQGDFCNIKYSFIKELSSASIGLTFNFDNWYKSNYIFFPAAVYNGNRFKFSAYSYPPFLSNNMGASENMDINITDVPRVNVDADYSAINLTTADVATPCFGFYDSINGRGTLIFCNAKNEFGYNGLKFEEDLTNGIAKFTIQAPVVREKFKYAFGTTLCFSDDKAKNFKKGESVCLKYCYKDFIAKDIHEFYKEFFACRKVIEDSKDKQSKLSFSAAFKVIESKYNLENFNNDAKYYRIGTIDNIYQDYQSGWTGGGINSYPLLVNGAELSKTRALQTLEFITNTIQNENGFYRAIYYNGKFYGDNYHDVLDQSILLIRKHCDLTYFLIKQYEATQNLNLKNSIIKACYALVKLFNKFGQLGQFIDIEKNEIYAGGTASGALAVGALCKAGIIFKINIFVETAKQIAEYYYKEFLCKGILNGGPGDIVQGCDSESAFNLLESFVALYECTNDSKYLDFAAKTAYQCSSWVVSYDFSFPANSTFCKANIKTKGSVFANVQNKHAAPGICTLSGDCLLRLYRYTKNKMYLDLIYDIASGITQYLATVENPIKSYGGKNLNIGYINERVNMSDWEGTEYVGEVFDGSTWAEVSCLLTCIEVPSIYIDIENNIKVDFDVIESKIDSDRLYIINKDNYKKSISILIEGKPKIIVTVLENQVLEIDL